MITTVNCGLLMQATCQLETNPLVNYQYCTTNYANDTNYLGSSVKCVDTFCIVLTAEHNVLI